MGVCNWIDNIRLPFIACVPICTLTNNFVFPIKYFVKFVTVKVEKMAGPKILIYIALISEVGHLFIY